jgi:predicted ribosome quality control (RQC) complex YloA/Tae2 family protein
MLIHMTTGERPADGEPYIALKLRSSEADDKQNQMFFLAITGTTNPQMDFISGSGLSLFRWNSQGCYTVRKPAESYLAALTREEDYAESIALLMSTLLPSQVEERTEAGTSQGTESAHSQSTLPLYQREARDRVARRLKTLKKTTAQDQRKIPSEGDIADLKLKAGALRSWVHLVKEGQHELSLDREMVGGSFANDRLMIELDPDVSGGENLNRMFAKLQKMDRARTLGSQRAKRLIDQVTAMESALETLRSPTPLSTAETTALLAKCGLQSSSHAKTTPSTHKDAAPKSSLGRTFLSADQAIILLGRTALENDQLTKSAKSNDWWLHVSSGVHGTHVIVPARSLPKGELNATTLREAMILAVHFSSLSLSKEGEVYVTKRGALKKRKGAPAGLWQIGRSETMMVRYTDEDLKAIFSREKRLGTIRHQED